MSWENISTEYQFQITGIIDSWWWRWWGQMSTTSSDSSEVDSSTMHDIAFGFWSHNHKLSDCCVALTECVLRCPLMECLTCLTALSLSLSPSEWMAPISSDLSSEEAIVEECDVIMIRESTMSLLLLKKYAMRAQVNKTYLNSSATWFFLASAEAVLSKLLSNWFPFSSASTSSSSSLSPSVLFPSSFWLLFSQSIPTDSDLLPFDSFVASF